MKNKNFKLLALALSFGLVFTACSNDNAKNEETKEVTSEESTTGGQENKENKEEKKDDTEASKEDYDFTVVSREDGSGTRGAFVELVGLMEKVDGEEEDMTTLDAIVQNSTNGVMQTVAKDTNAIGYISLGSLNDSVKALKIDGVEATEENIANGSYKLQRPFNLAYKESELDDLAKDFLAYVSSSDAQKIVADLGYVPLKDSKAYEKKDVKGNLTVAGSTSVTPLMEKMAEEYEKLNPDVKIEIQSTGSSAGIEAVIDGAANIAMASRELKDEEKEQLTPSVIATDGIAVVVNKESKVSDISLDDLKEIFAGNILNTSELEK